MNYRTDEGDRPELDAALQKLCEAVSEQYYYEFWDWIVERQLCDLTSPFTTPKELFESLAQGLADISGYKVILQEAILECCADDPSMERTVGHRDAIIAEPMLFVRASSDNSSPL